MNIDSHEFWDTRYLEGRTGWDIGYPSPALMHYCADIPFNKNILIPGAGNAHEWVALKEAGYEHVTVVDISDQPLQALRKKYPQWTDDLIHANFFDHEGTYDLILEQTFFSALLPEYRARYVSKMRQLLKPDGTLAGLLFNRNFEQDGPPFGGTVEEYKELFNSEFSMLSLIPCENSIPERLGSEVFLEASLH